MRSELTYYTFKNFIGELVVSVMLPVVLLKYKEFWGLRCAALRHGGVIAKCYYKYVARFGASIPLSVKMDGPPCFPHGLSGIFMGNLTHLGKGVTILQQVTIGMDTFAGEDANARRFIGDNVFIGAGAKIIGGVVIGKNCRIGANCCVYQDLPPNSVAVMQPTRIIQKENLDNTIYCGKLRSSSEGWVKKEEM